jgi:hypothetical protein
MNYSHSIMLGGGSLTFDPDARAYIAAVEAADGQALEPAIRTAYDNFIRGCKSNGIWDAIKASCILAGARSLSGALVPLKGSAPTNNNFVSGDYARKTGLVGDGTTKYLNSNRNNNADPQNSKHMSVYFGAELPSAGGGFRCHLGIAPLSGNSGASVIGTDALTDGARYRNNGLTSALVASGLAVGLKGVSRSSSSAFIVRQNSANTTNASTSQTPLSLNYFVFARNTNGTVVESFADSRLAFYSIGESLDLAALDARVTTLTADITAAIP